MTTGLNIVRLVNLWPPFGQGHEGVGAVAGPYRVVEGDTNSTGSGAGDIFSTGTLEGDTYSTGNVAGQAR